MTRHIVVSTCIVTSLAIARSAFAQATAVHEFTLNFPIDFVVANPCVPEMVTIAGSQDSVLQVTANSSGGLLVKLHDAITGTGLGTTGNKYTFGLETDDEVIVAESSSITDTNSLHLVSVGQPDNFIMTVMARIVFNGDVPTAGPVQVQCRCGGPDQPEIACVLP